MEHKRIGMQGGGGRERLKGKMSPFVSSCYQLDI